MGTSSYVILEYEFKVNGKIPSDLLSSFEDKFIKFFYYFCDHILFDINFYFPNKEIYNAYWPNIHSELTEIKEIDKNLFKVKLWFAYDETLSKRGKKKLIEHCKEFIRRMNKFFELFGYDVRFGDEPISEEVYDPVEEYGIVPDYEDLFLDDEDDEDS